MRDIWLISDTHFQHANILKFKDGTTGELIRGRLFSSVDEMDECMMENWNKVVKPGDIVYHLGDVLMGDKDAFLPKWQKLNGTKRLIVGNHDDIKYIAKTNMFSKIQMWRMFPEFGLLFSHVPLHESSLYRFPSKDDHFVEDAPIPKLLNIHGHIHQNPSPSKDHRCVCVEQINYTPINIEELRIK